MATYFTGSSNPRDPAPMHYLREPLSNSYSEAPALPNNVMMYVNSGSYSDAIMSADSHPQNISFAVPSLGANTSGSIPQHQEIITNLGGLRNGGHDLIPWREDRNEMLVTHATGGQYFQGQGLSLSLCTQIQSGIQIPSIQCRNHIPGFATFLSPNPSISGDGDGENGPLRDDQSRNGDYLPPEFSGANQEKGDFPVHGISGVRTIPNSKYLRAAQQLLNEVVNLRKALKEGTKRKQSTNEEHVKSPKVGEEGLNDETGDAIGASKNPQESASNPPCELSHAEKQDLQNNLIKLLSMLDEIDRRYKQYYHQMQIVVSSFDVIAGCGAAKPYTALALQTISCHFRCLRDAVTGQICATRESLGEQDALGNGKGVGITRLRFVDQQLRQQGALQQLGMMQQHAWRPQRGLPESAVSILRAWLFEHFLHPYPKDSDKIMLARQTGLTRSQVSNWFINARVRLWKPMVEEMYKEEIRDDEMDSISSSDIAAKATKGDAMISEDRIDDLQQCQSSTASERCSTEQFTASNVLNGLPDGRQESEIEYRLLKQMENQRSNVDECGIFPDTVVQSGGGNERFMAAAAAAYHMSGLGSFGPGTGVSLTLGLQQCEGGNVPMSSGTHHSSFVSMREDIDVCNAAAAAPSSLGAEREELECMNAAKQQRFSSSQMLHDFTV